MGALNLGAGTKGSVVHDLVSSNGQSEVGEKVTVRAGHYGGVAESTVRFKEGKPESVVMMRTARMIMDGNISIPERVFR